MSLLTQAAVSTPGASTEAFTTNRANKPTVISLSHDEELYDETGAFDEIHSFAKPNNEIAEGILVRLNSLEDLYVEQLQDLYSDEEQVV